MISDQLSRLTCGVLVHSAQMAFVENAAGTRALLQDLTSLFRHLSGENKKIPIERELAIIEDYIHLQQLRYPGRFDFSNLTGTNYYNIYIQSGSVLELLDSTLTSLLENTHRHFLLTQSIEGGNPEKYTLRLTSDLYANIVHKQLDLTYEI